MNGLGIVRRYIYAAVADIRETTRRRRVAAARRHRREALITLERARYATACRDAANADEQARRAIATIRTDHGDQS